MSSNRENLEIPPLVKGYFTWNDHDLGLDFVSTSSDKTDHPLLHSHTKDARASFNPNKLLPAHVIAGLPSTLMVYHPRDKDKENRFVQIKDVRSIAVDLLIADHYDRGIKSISKDFQWLVMNESFENLLVTLLEYFETFFQQVDHNKHLAETTFLHPSRAEVEKMETTRCQLMKCRQSVAQQYCVLLLGINMPDTHHLGCGKERSSQTHRDQRLFEEAYTFFTYFVWVAFRRRDFKTIFIEVGEMLRSDTFNPAYQRIYQRMFYDLADKNDQPFHLSKRPPITSIIHQRSEAMTSLLPTPKETMKSGGHCKNPIKQNLTQKYVIMPGRKLGIIGESFELFNRIDLTPKDAKQIEDGSEVSDQKSGNDIKQDNKMPIRHPLKSPSKIRLVKRRKAFSRATTAEKR